MRLRNINSKYEIRNSKQIQNSNFSMFQTMLLKMQDKGFDHLGFENLNIVSDFELRISDFSLIGLVPKE